MRLGEISNITSVNLTGQLGVAQGELAAFQGGVVGTIPMEGVSLVQEFTGLLGTIDSQLASMMGATAISTQYFAVSQSATNIVLQVRNPIPLALSASQSAFNTLALRAVNYIPLDAIAFTGILGTTRSEPGMLMGATNADIPLWASHSNTSLTLITPVPLILSLAASTSTTVATFWAKTFVSLSTLASTSQAGTITPIVAISLGLSPSVSQSFTPNIFLGVGSTMSLSPLVSLSQWNDLSLLVPVRIPISDTASTSLLVDLTLLVEKLLQLDTALGSSDLEILLPQLIVLPTLTLDAFSFTSHIGLGQTIPISDILSGSQTGGAVLPILGQLSNIYLWTPYRPAHRKVRGGPRFIRLPNQP